MSPCMSLELVGLVVFFQMLNMTRHFKDTSCSGVGTGIPAKYLFTPRSRKLSLLLVRLPCRGIQKHLGNVICLEISA